MHGVDAIHATGTTGSGADARRNRAHKRARNHSTQVRYLRRLIPLSAGAAILALVVGTLFNPFGTVLPAVTMGPVTLSGTKVKMENPRLSGFRKDDRGYEVIATAAFQDVRKPTLIELQAMKGHLRHRRFRRARSYGSRPWACSIGTRDPGSRTRHQALDDKGEEYPSPHRRHRFQGRDGEVRPGRRCDASHRDGWPPTASTWSITAASSPSSATSTRCSTDRTRPRAPAPRASQT